MKRISLWFRSLNRKRRVARYERDHGTRYPFRAISVSIPEYISFDLKNALLRNKYETEEANFIEMFLPNVGDVIELGGSIGVVSAYTRSRLAPEAHQIVVEANPDLAEICRANIAPHDPDGHSRVVQAAVSYSGQDSIAFYLGDNPHVGSTGGQGRRIDVPVTTIEDICAQHGIDRFSLICDIEGAELELFEKSSLWKTKCDLIILETHPDVYDGGVSDQTAMIEAILAAGFSQVGADRGVFAFHKAA